MKSQFFLVVSETSRASHLHRYFLVFLFWGISKRAQYVVEWPCNCYFKKKKAVLSAGGAESSFKANACNTGAY